MVVRRSSVRPRSVSCMVGVPVISISPALRPLEQAAQMQQRRLAGARRRDDGDEFAALDVEIGGFEHAHHGLALAVMAVDAGAASDAAHS